MSHTDATAIAWALNAEERTVVRSMSRADTIALADFAGWRPVLDALKACGIVFLASGHASLTLFGGEVREALMRGEAA